MTPFSVERNPNPKSDEERAAILAAPGFGKHFTDHMVRIDYADGAWGEGRVLPYGPLTFDPASAVFHYGQEIFEGLKAYRQSDGSVAAFRPDANARRFARSAQRLGMAQLPAELFVESIRSLVDIDRDWVPNDPEESLYLRPFMIASEVGLGVNSPSTTYTFLTIASPAGSYFSGGIKPVKVWLSTEYTRAAPGGTGEAKCGGNYAAAFVGQAQATAQGCDQVVWLDALEHRWIEEMGGMNLFFVFTDSSGAVEVVTPELSGSLLPGVTRRSLLELAAEEGATVTERRISTEEMEKEVAAGHLTEVFACGTAAVITPVGSVKHEGGSYDIGDGTPGPMTHRLRDRLTAIQRGAAPDPRGWMQKLA